LEADRSSLPPTDAQANSPAAPTADADASALTPKCREPLLLAFMFCIAALWFWRTE